MDKESWFLCLGRGEDMVYDQVESSDIDNQTSAYNTEWMYKVYDTFGRVKHLKHAHDGLFTDYAYGSVTEA